MSYEIGQKVRVSLTVVNEAGVPTNATMTIAVVKPNLTVAAAPTATNDGVGLYHFDVTPDAVPGPWQWTATASGAVVSVQRGQFWVRDPAVNMISLEEIKRHLNKTVTIDDDELRDWIDAGRFVIEREVGAVLPSTVTEYHSGYGRRAIILRRGPVISVTSVAETDIAGTTTNLVPEAGALGDNEFMFRSDDRSVIRRGGGHSRYWGRDVSVVFVAGRYPIPMNHKMALGELISHLWRSSQMIAGRTRPNLDSPDAIAVGYAIPNRVRELLGRRRGPRIGGM